MKTLLVTFLMAFSLQSFATIDTIAEAKGKAPTESEIQSNRACFTALEREGCGDPGDDVEHFRSCLKTVYPDLKADCKILMTDLYGIK